MYAAEARGEADARLGGLIGRHTPNWAMLKRLDHLEVATADLADAAAVYQRNFDFTVIRSADGTAAAIQIGDSEIRLISGDRTAEIIANSGEGMFSLWLEAADVESVAAALRKSGIDPGPIKKEQDRRILTVDPRHASQVPLFIFDRKA